MPALIVTPKYVWKDITMALPATSLYFTHGQCAGCIRPNGSQLSAATIKHVCLVLVDAVSGSDPESRVYRRIRDRKKNPDEFPSIASKSSRDPRTVMMTLAHLRTVGLIDVVRHGGREGVARGLPSVYALTIPDAALLKLARVDTEILQRAEEQLRQAPAPPGWFAGAGHAG